MNGTASDRVRLSLKSTRSAIRSPTADRTAATRAIPSDPVPDTFILAERKPRPSHPIASCAARSGGTVPIQALNVTSFFTRPPRSEWTGRPSARALRSTMAISTAAIVS